MATASDRLAERRRQARRIILTAVVAALAVTAFPGAALAQTGNQRFVSVTAGHPGGARTVVAAGVINGVGTEVIESNPPGIVTLRWIFPDGTLFVTGSYTFDVHVDPRTCLRTVALAGTWEITGGTGRFEGATGSGTFSGSNRILGTRAADGSCGPPPVVVAQVFGFNGVVTLDDNAG